MGYWSVIVYYEKDNVSLLIVVVVVKYYVNLYHRFVRCSGIIEL